MTIFKYIFKRLFSGTVLLTVVLVFAIWLIQSIRFLDMIVNRNVSLKGYFYLISFLIPDLFVIIFPICMFIAIVFFYNKFQSDHELVIWKSSGMSPLNIARPALVLSSGVVIFTLFLTIFVLPSSYKHFKDYEHRVRQQFSSALLHEGRFNSIKDATVYVKHRSRQGYMEGILLYHVNKGKPYTIMAQSGRIQLHHHKVYLLLKNGVRQEVNAKTKALSTLYFDTLTYNLSDIFQESDARSKRPYEKNIKELLNPTHDLDPIAKQKHYAAAHQRILQPLLGLTYALIAVVFLLTGTFSRRGRSKHVAGALISGFAFQALMMLLMNQGLYGIYAAYGLWFVLTVSLFGYLVYDRGSFPRAPKVRQA